MIYNLYIYSSSVLVSLCFASTDQKKVKKKPTRYYYKYKFLPMRYITYITNMYTFALLGIKTMFEDSMNGRRWRLHVATISSGGGTILPVSMYITNHDAHSPSFLGQFFHFVSRYMSLNVWKMIGAICNNDNCSTTMLESVCCFLCVFCPFSFLSLLPEFWIMLWWVLVDRVRANEWTMYNVQTWWSGTLAMSYGCPTGSATLPICKGGLHLS